MLYNILAIGDVVGGCGVSCLEHHLRAVKKLKNIHFTVVNGENAAMVGLTPNDAERIFSAGADVITLGNHTFGKVQISDYLDDCPYILRPHNLGARVPGRGYGVFRLRARPHRGDEPHRPLRPRVPCGQSVQNGGRAAQKRRKADVHAA